MKKYTKGLGAFLRNLKECMAAARRDCDTWYHIPKDRFNGGPEERRELDYVSEPVKRPLKKGFLGSFRDCFVKAWVNSDEWYNIPKSRFQDPEFNRTAYRSSKEVGILGRVMSFPGVLKHCISMAWGASDVFYHLPKSRYRDEDFVRDLMKLSPRPRTKLLHWPYSIGFGVVVGEGTGKDWTVEPQEEKPEDVYFVPDQASGAGDKPDIEM